MTITNVALACRKRQLRMHDWISIKANGLSFISIYQQHQALSHSTAKQNDQEEEPKPK